MLYSKQVILRHTVEEKGLALSLSPLGPSAAEQPQQGMFYLGLYVFKDMWLVKTWCCSRIT